MKAIVLIVLYLLWILTLHSDIDCRAHPGKHNLVVLLNVSASVLASIREFERREGECLCRFAFDNYIIFSPLVKANICSRDNTSQVIVCSSRSWIGHARYN